MAEMARAYMVERFGSEAYTAGYRVVTTIADTYQPAAQEALQAGLIGYDRRHGYRGPEAHHDLPPGAGESDWKRILTDYPNIGALRPALVVGIRDRSVMAFNTDSGLFALDWDGLLWARPYVDNAHRGPAPKRAGDILQAGDVIGSMSTTMGYSRSRRSPRPKAPWCSWTPPTARSWRCRRLRFFPEQPQPRHTGAPPTRLRLRAVHLFRGPGSGLHRGQHRQRCPHHFL